MARYDYERVPVGMLSSENLLEVTRSWGKKGWRVIHVLQANGAANSWFVLLEGKRPWWSRWLKP